LFFTQQSHTIAQPSSSSAPSNPKSELEAFHRKEMAKSDAKKRAEMMAKEWKKSQSNTKSLNDLVGMGLLHNQELGGWRALEGESYPDLTPVRS